LFRGRRGKKSLGMAGHVVFRQIPVLDLEQNVSGAVNQDRAERVIAVAAGALCHREATAQQCLMIKRRHGIISPQSMRTIDGERGTSGKPAGAGALLA